MRGSSDNPPNPRRPRDLARPCTKSHSRVRLPIPRWGSLAVLGILASVLCYLAERKQPDPSISDGSLLGEHATWVQSVAIDRVGHRLASGGGDGSVYLWDLTRRELAMALKRVPGSKATFAYCLAFSPDGAIQAAANCDGSVTMWEVALGTHRYTFSDNSRSIRCLAFSPDGQFLAMGTDDHSIELWDAVTNRRVADLPGGAARHQHLLFARRPHPCLRQHRWNGESVGRVDRQAHPDDRGDRTRYNGALWCGILRRRAIAFNGRPRGGACGLGRKNWVEVGHREVVLGSRHDSRILTPRQDAGVEHD